MAEIVLLPEQQFTSVYVDGTGWCQDIPATFDLVPGQSYRIVFDGAEWPCVAVDISAMIPSTVAIGNGAAFGLPGNGEPFAVVDYIGGDEISILCLTDSATQNTHTISIYGEESVEPEEPESPKVSNDAVLLSYSQNPVVYNNIPKVWLTHPDSTDEDVKLVPFTYGEAVSKSVTPDFTSGDMAVDIPDGELVKELTVVKPEELVPENIPEGKYIAGVGPGTFKGGSEGVEKTVELDFSGGDMKVEPEAGKAFSAVTIPKPENLVPKNIAEGVNIAGIVGALAAGGARFAAGKIEGRTGTINTLNHNMGVVPDFIFIYGSSSTTSSGVYYISSGAFAFNDNVKELAGIGYNGQYIPKNGGSGPYLSQEQPLTNTTQSGFAHGATETTIKLGTKYNNRTYGLLGTVYWFAFGGLT